MTGDGYALVLHGDADASKLGGTAVCGFSSTGMVGVIAASHMIRAWNLEQMGTVLDENFPAMALVQESIPKHPVRVYQGDGIGVFTGYLLSEGDRRGLNITALLADCNPLYPDARAAAFATEAVSELVDREIPLGELLEDARKIEDNVREMFERSQSMLPAPEGYDVSQSQDDPMVN
jgi:predicted ATP-grasp superfamily ATP-dependent carboligase